MLYQDEWPGGSCRSTQVKDADYRGTSFTDISTERHPANAEKTKKVCIYIGSG